MFYFNKLTTISKNLFSHILSCKVVQLMCLQCFTFVVRAVELDRLCILYSGEGVKHMVGCGFVASHEKGIFRSVSDKKQTKVAFNEQN